MSGITADNPEAGLSRRLGLFAATMVGTGVILGAGIYVLVGVASKQAGNAAPAFPKRTLNSKKKRAT